MNLVLQNLCKSYPTRSGELSVLRDINLTLDTGAALAILGPSGSGKSTLLYLLGTLERATSGTYKLGDQEPFRLTDVPRIATRFGRPSGPSFVAAVLGARERADPNAGRGGREARRLRP